jgi:succinoglycan biosynthesis transport protein ExoP
MTTPHNNNEIELLRSRPAVFSASAIPRAEARSTAGSGSALNIRVLRRGFRRYWLQYLLLWVFAATVVSVVVYKKFRPTFEASSLLKVDLMSRDPFGEPGRAWGSDDILLETQVQLVTSTKVLRAAASDKSVAKIPLIQAMEDPSDLLRGLLVVRVLPRSYLIRVSLTWSSSEEAAALVNSVVNAYLSADAERDDDLTRNQIHRLEDFRDELRKHADDLKKVWLEIAAQGNVEPTIKPGDKPADHDDRPSRPSRMSVTTEEYKKLRGDLIKSKLDLAEAIAHLDVLRQRWAERHTEGSATNQQDADRLLDDRELGELQKKIEVARGQYLATKKKVRDILDPSLVKLRDSWRDLEAQSRALRAEKIDALRRDPQVATSKPSESEQALGAAETRVASLTASRSQLEEMLDQLDVANRNQATDSVKMTLVQTELEQVQAMLDQVNKRLQSLRFASQSASRSIRIDEARPAAAPATDKRPRILAMIPLVTLLMVLGVSTLLEVRAGRVDCPQDLSHRVRAEVFTVPPLPSLRDDGRVATRIGSRTSRDPAAEFAQQIDHLRVALCDTPIPGRGRCILITSAVGGEGKTTLAAQLAARCADSGLSTLLIDADLRRATLGESLGETDSLGLADVLRGSKDIDEVLVAPVQLGGCRFLAAGTPETNPGRVIQGNRAGAVFEQLLRRFDIVIVDAPPVLPVPDALTLGRWVDGVLLATRHDTSRLPLLQQAQKLLVSAGIPLLGVVVNGVHPMFSGRAGYTYSYPTRRGPVPTR